LSIKVINASKNKNEFTLIATTWNLLLDYSVNAATVNAFKSRIDAHVALGTLRTSVYQAWTNGETVEGI